MAACMSHTMPTWAAGAPFGRLGKGSSVRRAPKGGDSEVLGLFIFCSAHPGNQSQLGTDSPEENQDRPATLSHD